MHFFYLDESGDTGADLDNAQQPVLVVGGISVSDERWAITLDIIETRLRQFFQGDVPPDFELHAMELLNPQHKGPISRFSFEQRCALCLDLLRLITDRNHAIHYFAIDKQQLKHEGTHRVNLVVRPGRGMRAVNDFLKTVCAKPRKGWQSRYGITDATRPDANAIGAGLSPG